MSNTLDIYTSRLLATLARIRHTPITCQEVCHAKVLLVSADSISDFLSLLCFTRRQRAPLTAQSMTRPAH